MPLRPLRPCSFHGCAELIRTGSYCEEHKTQRMHAYDDGRKDTKEKQFYNSAQWQRLRNRKRQLDPLCEICAREGKTVVADLVHHKIEIRVDWSRRFDWDNLESICTPCHERIHQKFKR